MRISDFKARGVATRLWSGFGVVLALLVAVAGFSLDRLHGLQQQADALVSGHIRMLDTVGQMQDAAAQRSVLLRDMVMNDSLKVQREVKQKLQANGTLYADASKRFAALASTSAVATAGADVKQILTLADSIAATEKSALGRVSDARFDEAKEFLADTLTPQHNELNRLLRAFFVATMADAGRTVDLNRHNYNLVSTLVAAFTLLAIGVGVSIAFMTARGIVTPVAQARQAAIQMARGDLTQPIVARSADEIGQLLRALEHMRRALVQSVTDIRGVADGVSSGAQQIDRGNSDLSARTEAQASSLQETASSMEELTTTVQQNSGSAGQASVLAGEASAVARRGGDAVRGVVSTMQEIHDSSRRIADITAVIDSIAFQTNILALNAAVEAARAGEQGRGFAVVAAEVRSLAQRSAQAAREIKVLIQESAGRVGGGVRQVEAAGRTMDEIVASSGQLNSLIAEIAHASAEQLAGIEQVNRAITQMERNTQQNATVVEDAAAAAERLAGQAQAMVLAVARFSVDGQQAAAGRPGLSFSA